MKKQWAKGVLTVFLALLAPVFLGILFALIESVRVSGSRAHIANIVDMANYSLFGEYEKKLLSSYEIFAVDGTGGTGDYSLGRVNERFMKYLEKNSSPGDGNLSELCFDPWQVSPSYSEITAVALLTDKGCENFYQQAVSFMKETAVTGITDRLLNYYRQTSDIKDKQEQYEREKYSSDKELAELEEKEEKLKEEQKENAGEAGISGVQPQLQDAQKNPLKELAGLVLKGTLKIVCPDMQISDGSVLPWELCSKRPGKKTGSMELKKQNGGLVDDLLFREYLLDHLGNCLEKKDSGKLAYQLEYVIGGKNSDSSNLKAVLKKLLLMREGCNYAYAASDEAMSSEAGLLAAGVIGWTGIPALVAALKHGLLLGWAYGESLLDLKALMDGGRVQLFKDSGSWQLSLSQLGNLPALLQEKRRGNSSGLRYRDYLRLLLYMQGVSNQKKRGLDMIEDTVRRTDGLSQFRADHCLVGIQEESSWSIRPLFSRVTYALLDRAGTTPLTTVRGGFAYE